MRHLGTQEIGFVQSGQYQKVRCLDGESRGKVWLMLHGATGELRVVKKVENTEASLAMLRLWVTLSHPGLPRIYDLVQEEDAAWCIMEYIPGQNLKVFVGEYRRLYGRIPEKRAAAWGIELCRILEYLHSRTPPMIYQDLKPSNIILSLDGRLRLIDPDSAGVLQKRGRLAGTKGFLAPEQQNEQGSADSRSDIYSLGRTLYWILGGEEGEYSQISAAMCRVLRRCTMEDPQKRYANCRTLAKSLEGAVKARNRRCILCCAAAAAVLVLGGMSRSVQNMRKEKHQREEQYQFYLSQHSISAYKSAIFLFPGREEGYQQFLDFLTEDGELDREEHQSIQKVLRETEVQFSKNTAAYRNFAYRLGMVYWFQYGESGGRRHAAAWFGRFLRMGQEQRKGRTIRAEVFCAIAEYCEVLEHGDETGDVQVDYLKFWQESGRLLQLPAEEEDRLVTALRLWNEMAGFLYQSREAFWQAGITEVQWEERLKSLRKKLDALEYLQNQRENGGKKAAEGSVEKALMEELANRLDILEETE